MGLPAGLLLFLAIQQIFFFLASGDWTIWLPCVVSTGTYLFGTSAVFRVLTRNDASRLSPLLGLKIIALGLIVSLVFGQTLSVEQWACGDAVRCRGNSSSAGRLRPACAITHSLLSCGCICFAIADLGIVEMIDAIQNILSLTRFSAGCLALLVTYVFIGLIVFPLQSLNMSGAVPDHARLASCWSNTP